MSITLSLKPDVEARAQAQAAARGLPVEEYLQQAIEHMLSPALTGANLLDYWKREGVLGAWEDRDDITDRAAYARDLRRQAETRN